MSFLDHAFFYNDEDGDREYDAESFEYWLKKFFTSGVFEGEFQVTAAGGMIVNIGGGYCNADGKVKFEASTLSKSIETADATYDRIDTIVMERNDTERDVTCKVVKGSLSSTPVATAPVRENGIYQLVLAQIYVAAGATEITDSVITDTRTDTDLCGIVTGTVTNYDFDQFKVQFEAWVSEYKESAETDYDSIHDTMQNYSDTLNNFLAELTSKAENEHSEYTDSLKSYLDSMETSFDDWFAEMKGQLSEDAAGNLQNEIDDNEIDCILKSGFASGTSVKSYADGVKTFTETESTSTSTDSDGNVTTTGGRYITTTITTKDGQKTITRALYTRAGTEIAKQISKKISSGNWSTTLEKK